MPLPLFGKSHKSPPDIVKNLKDSLTQLEKLERGDKKNEKVAEEVSKSLQAIKGIIYGQESQEPHMEQVAQLAQEAYNSSILPMLIQNLIKLDFEAKKDVAQIFNNLLRRQIGTRSPTVEYVHTRPQILETLVKGYETPEIAVTCGSMLRECIRHENLAKLVLYGNDFYKFFNYVEFLEHAALSLMRQFALVIGFTEFLCKDGLIDDVSTFDIASDAFSTFKELVTRHKAVCAEFLDSKYDEFFQAYQNLLNSENYVTRRQSLKLLGELLLDRHNFNIMTRYINNADNLKLMMNMLKEKSRSIQFEAFHVFKVFVANPNKSKAVADILLRNKEKLVEFLTNFHTDRTEDEQFNDEKAYLIKQIQDMKA